MRYFITILCIAITTCSVFASGQQMVTYTVTSKTAVLAEGYEPLGAMAMFEQTGTGQKGQMTAGNSTTFVLTGLQGVYLHGVSLQMRSNTANGAGELQMTAGRDVLWTIDNSSFAAEAWNGMFSTAYVPIVWSHPVGYLFDSENNALQIQIAASENSLYVSSYTLYYSDAPKETSVVSFHTGTSVKIDDIAETNVGEGIVLPDCQSADEDWQFMGWTTETVARTENKADLPKLYLPAERFYPAANTTLYALYSDGEEAPEYWLQDTTLQTGYYLIADSLFGGIWPAGAVQNNGHLPFYQDSIIGCDEQGRHIAPSTKYLDAAVYHLTFLPDSLVRIKHVQTNTFVGYPRKVSGELTQDSVMWNYRVIKQWEVIFYHTYGKDWIQLRATFNNTGDVYYGRYKTTYVKTGNILFNTADIPIPTVVHYTSYPLGTGTSVLQHSLPVQITSRGVENPHHITLSLYTLLGQHLLTTQNTISFSQLTRGIYLLQGNNVCCKVYVP